jgi:conjugal transfer pilus assembly protein TraF
MILLISLMVGWMILASSQASHFYERHAEGWFWYEPGTWNQEPGIRKEETAEDKPRSLAEKASETLAAYKKNLEQKLHLALMSPTSQNVQQYMQAQKEMMERSEQFSKRWQQVVLMNPDLNQEVKFPTAQYARHVYDDQIRQKTEQTIQRFSKTFGLFYFFSGDCPYCHEFAPIIKMFAEKYQWEVMAISMDGSSIDLFENTQKDNGIAAALGVQSVPTLMAYNATTQELVPLSYAPTSLDQLEANIMVLVGEE